MRQRVRASFDSGAASGLQPGADERADLLLIRERTCLQLRIDELAVELDLEASSVGRNQRESVEALLEVVEDLGRQTDGLRLIVSSRAVGQGDLHEALREPSA